MQRIGIVTEDYWRGGLARSMITLVNHWPERKTEFIVFTNRENTILKEYIHRPNVQYVYFDFKTVSSGMGEKRGLLEKIYRQTLFKYGFFIFRYFTLKRLFNRYRMDSWLIASGGYPGSDLCRLALMVLKKKKAVFVFHSAVQKPLIPFYPLEYLLDRIIFTGSRCKIVTVSHANSRTVSQRPWLGNLEIGIIHNGVADVERKVNKTHSSDRKIVSMISTFPPYKGHEVIIKAANRLKESGFDLQVRFYGTDFEILLRTVHERIAASAHPEIFSMPGYEEVDRVMSDADLIVVPSLAHESFGYAAAEALCYGVPVIVSDIGGLPEIVGNCGLIRKAGDIKEWADAIKTALTDPELRETNINRGMKRADTFSAKYMSLNYRTILLDGTRHDH